MNSEEKFAQIFKEAFAEKERESKERILKMLRDYDSLSFWGKIRYKMKRKYSRWNRRRKERHERDKIQQFPFMD